MPKIKTFKTFLSYVQIHMIEAFPDRIVDVKTVKKDNGYQTGIVIHQKDTIFAPIIYLNPYFDKLQAGTPLPDILDEITNDYKARFHEAVNVNLDNIKNFTSVKDKICYRLVNKEFNKQLLSDIPYRDFYGMAVIYYVKLPSTGEVINTIKVTNNLADLWNVNETQLYELASKNTPIQEKGCITPLYDTVREITGLPAANDDDRMYIPFSNFNMVVMYGDNCAPMYVATNISKTNGAGVILYDGLLKSVSRLLGSFFVLPSSIHECILVTGDLEDAESISRMVKEVNATVVSNTEVLSNNCLYYNAKDHSLEMIK